MSKEPRRPLGVVLPAGNVLSIFFIAPVVAVRNTTSQKDTRLDGLDAIYAASWPKAIHEGNGTLQLFITKKASDQQRKTLVAIMSGQAKGEGPFALFASTMKFVLEPQFGDIIATVNGKKSSFSVLAVLDVQTEGFTNPVTGEEQDTRLQLPNGFIWKLAEAAKSKLMHITTPNLKRH